MVAWARDELLKLLHPFMPFITEELWAVTANRDMLLTLTAWPRIAAEVTAEQLVLDDDPQVPPALMTYAANFADFSAEAEIGWVIDLITAIRSVRVEMNIQPATLTALVLAKASKETRERAARWGDVLKRMARLSDISFADNAPQGAVQLVVREEVAALPLKGVIDLAAEKTRLEKEIARANDDVKRAEAKLANEKFVANAKEEVVEEEREKREAALARRGKILEALERLNQAS
jgi:valyl-tRNA synthetase